MFNGILAYEITQRIGIPTVSPKQLLLPPRTRIAHHLRAHPARLTRLVAEQTIQKQAGIRRRSLLREQLPHATLHIAQCRRQQFPASPRPEHNQTMTFDSWSTIDLGDSVIRNRKITTV